MAEPLKHLLNSAVPPHIAAMLHAAWSGFDRAAFLADIAPGYEALELMQRGRRIADAMHRRLPAAYPEAVAILVASMGPAMGLGCGRRTGGQWQWPQRFCVPAP